MRGRRRSRRHEAFGRGELNARIPVRRKDELGELAATFNRTADRLEELLVAQEQFVSDASHQLRTPLTALSLRLENLEAEGPEFRVDDLDELVLDDPDPEVRQTADDTLNNIPVQALAAFNEVVDQKVRRVALIDTLQALPQEGRARWLSALSHEQDWQGQRLQVS